MTPSELTSRLDAGLSLIQKTNAYINSAYNTRSYATVIKEDSTPVTEIDRNTEEMLRDGLSKLYPQDGILGEEFGEKKSQNGLRWIIDPIDGTQSFIKSVPFFGTLLALEVEGKFTLGIVSMPALGEIYYGSKATGSILLKSSGEKLPLKVSATSTLEKAFFCYTTLKSFDGPKMFEVLLKLNSIAQLNRGWGDCYGHMLVAAGRCDFMLDPGLKIWDLAAIVPILENAQGQVTTLYKNALGHETILSSNSPLHRKVLELWESS